MNWKNVEGKVGFQKIHFADKTLVEVVIEWCPYAFPAIIMQWKSKDY